MTNIKMLQHWKTLNETEVNLDMLFVYINTLDSVLLSDWLLEGRFGIQIPLWTENAAVSNEAHQKMMESKKRHQR